MCTAVVVGDISVLDNSQMRSQVIRIPEVGIRIREAQAIVDRYTNQIDLYSVLNFDQNDFVQVGIARSILVSAVQLGLWDRYTRKNEKATVLVAPKGRLDMLLAMSGASTLEDVLRPILVPLFEGRGLVLSLTSPDSERICDMVRITILGPEAVVTECKTAQEVATKIVEDFNVQKIVNIGPGNSFISNQTIDPIFERLQIIESIDADVLLSWFWATQIRAIA